MGSLELPAARARAFVSQIASFQGADPFIAVLLTSELVSNVVLRARSAMNVAVQPRPSKTRCRRWRSSRHFRAIDDDPPPGLRVSRWTRRVPLRIDQRSRQ